MSARRRPFDVPVAVHALSALLGVLLAYDSRAAATKLVLVWAGVVVYGALSRIPSHVAWRGRDLPLLRLVVGLAPALVCGYFLLTNDWMQPVAKVAWLEPVRLWLADRTAPPLPRLHPNLAGGLLAAWLPLQVAALGPRPGQPVGRAVRHVAASPRVLLVVASCVGLLLSSLRGAWLALAASVIVWLWWRMSERLSGRRGWLIASSLWAAGLLLVVWAAVCSTWASALVGVRPDRVLVWRNSWALAWDYFFTGLGLGNFTMPYSSYALLIHVPHTTHAHNLFLDLWLEQGLIGLVAFAWMLVRGFTPGASAHPTRWRTAALLALLVIALHGLVDDVYYGYGGVGAVFLLVPLALLSRRGEYARQGGWRPGRRGAVIACGAAMAGFVLAVSWPTSRALAWSNLGAIRQTRLELSTYHWPEWPLQDEVRRAHELELIGSIGYYRAALENEPNCTSANRRLGQIELSLGEYDDARRHLARAYAAAPSQPATRQLFGESLALTGSVEWAADLWRTLPLEQDQLAIRQYWYNTAGDAGRAQWLKEAIALARPAGGGATPAGRDGQ